MKDSRWHTSLVRRINLGQFRTEEFARLNSIWAIAIQTLSDVSFVSFIIYFSFLPFPSESKRGHI